MSPGGPRRPDPKHPRSRAGGGRPSRPAGPGPAGSEAAPAEPADDGTPDDLDRTKRRLSRLYFAQVEENRRRTERLGRLLESLCWLNEEQDLDARLRHVVATVRAHLGFRRATVRLREPGAAVLMRRASAGPGEGPGGPYDAGGVPLETFEAWCAEGERISASTLLGRVAGDLEPPPDDAPAVDAWDWLPGMRLIVPIRSRHGELIGDLTVDEPGDGFVPPRDVVELLEILAQHAAVAIENARLVGQLERHARDLEETGRRTRELLSLKSAFLSGLSHELHAALTAIRATAESVGAVREGDLSFGQVRGFLLTVHDESRRLARLSESLLDFSRFAPGPIHPGRARFELGELLEQSAAVLRPLADAGQVALKLQIAVDDTAMEADQDQVRQLVLHLGRNALRSTPPGGEVTLRLNGDERDLMLEVEDNGVGIPEAQLESIFDRAHPDVGTRPAGDAAGLSLAICRSIVEWHGGRIYAEAEPGAGSRFTVVMPRRSGPRVTVHGVGRAGRAAVSDDSLRLVLEMVADVMSARAVTLFVPDELGRLVVRAGTGLDDSAAGSDSGAAPALAPGQGVAGWVFQHGRPACVPHAGARPEEREPLAGGAYLCVPIEDGGATVGVLGVSDPVGARSFGVEDAHLLLALAVRVSAAWSDARALERSEQNVAETNRALHRVLEHLELAGRRAPDRVRLARAIARALDLDEAEAGRIAYAASVHDLGMGGLDPRVLGGDAPLTPAEREAMERHPEIGVEMLAPLDRVGAVRDIVRCHHEWWDGSGYPRGLAGERIPVGARILAAVDAWQSMVVGRPHRAALAPEAALAELRRRRGVQFDPAVVDAFENFWRSEERERPATSAHAA